MKLYSCTANRRNKANEVLLTRPLGEKCRLWKKSYDNKVSKLFSQKTKEHNENKEI